MDIVTTCNYGALNDLSKRFLSVNDGESIVLDKNTIYDVCPEDSFVLTGYYVSNSASKSQFSYSRDASIALFITSFISSVISISF